ncbi:DUF1538 domain-containing protein [Desulfogranum marinum]|uniref:DUF1538 domain-containing protein n=1 Tax=Desulfogranum marinum TaxID=453220 RepID=UPI0029C81197|nr:DUF1538 domain-containing protein [Desulfogranum marinum]
MVFLVDFGSIFLTTCRDVIPIVILIVGFQVLVLREPIPHLRRLVVGGVFVVIGLALFLAGLEKALFPLGQIMATQLSDPDFIYEAGAVVTKADWKEYGWIYLFAAMIGFATTIAEPSLIAVAFKANEASAGTLSQWGLRITVAIGVAFGISLGCFRIISGTPLYIYVLVGYLIVIVQTLFAPKNIIPLAYDSGGVTTSTVTVPLVAALGLGLASTVPGRNPALDGFGLIAFASLFPIISVMGYAQLMEWSVKRKKRIQKLEKTHAL